MTKQNTSSSEDGKFEPFSDMSAIEGIIADLSAKTDRPQGYPFSKITVYSACHVSASRFMPEYCHASADKAGQEPKLDFKKAGKAFPEKVKEWKADLSKVPCEFLVHSTVFDKVDESKRKTTGDRRFLVEVGCEAMPDLWLVIQFRKAVKKYVTEDLALNIVPAIFRDTFTSDDEFLATGKMYKDEAPVIPRVIVTIGNCSERLYQALEEYGVKEFAGLPIRIRIPSRQYICEHMGEHAVKFGAETARLDVEF